MKKSFTKKILLVAIAGLMAVNAWGDIVPATYCNYEITESADKTILITWQTLRNGDVKIEIADGSGVTNTTFRNGAFEGGMNGFHVLSGDGYAISESADTYFTRDWEDNSAVFYLRKKSGVTLPNPCIISFTDEALAWKHDQSVSGSYNPYKKPCPFYFEYGVNCQSLAAPTNVSISATGRISFDEVAGADGYEVTIYDGSTLIHSQDVAKNDILDFVAMSTTTLSVYVRALKEDFIGPRSDKYEWSVEAGHVYAHSHICDYTIQNGSNSESQVLISWETNLLNGDLEITIAPKEGGDEAYTYWVEDGMRIGGFRFNGENTFANYFDAVYSQSSQVPVGTTKLIYHPKTTGDFIPHYGDVISFAKDYVVYRYAESPDHVWPSDLSFPSYVYGTKCSSADSQNPVISAFSATPSTTSITFHVEASDVDDESTDQTGLLTYTLTNAANNITDQVVVPDGSGNFTISGLKKNIKSSFTLTATDPSGNDASQTIEVRMAFDTEENLAKDKTCSAGGAWDPANQANDGNMNSHWGTYNWDTKPEFIDWPTTNTWEVDLGQAYVLDSVAIYRGDGGDAHTLTLKGKMKAEDAWFTIFNDLETSAKGRYREVSAVASARYLQLSASGNSMLAIDEFEVYGHDYAVPDATNPTVEVTCPSKTINSATLQINASDLVDGGAAGAIAAINITGDNGFVAQNNVTLDGSNQITLEGLTYNTTYTFTVTVFDRARNQASTSIEVQLPLNTNFNLARGKTAVAGKIQDNSSVHAANLGCDGNASTAWSSYGTQDQSKEWWYVDLGALYTIRQIKIKWMNDYSQHFIIQGVKNLPAEENIEDDSYWTTYLDHTYAEDPGTEVQTHDVVGKMRYLRLKSLQNEAYLGMEFYELEVYGSDYATEDNVAPVMGTASATTNTETATATLTLTATDAVDGAIKDFYISCENPVMTETKYTTDGSDQIAITSLETDKDYSFTVRCRDLSGNWTSTTVVAHFAMALGTNVAEGKTATAGSYEEGHPAADAVDGNRTTTRWGNWQAGGADLVGNINWWEVDLHNAYKLTHIAITWEHYPDNGGIIIEGSVNDIDFTEIVSYSGERITTNTRQVLDVPELQLNEPYRFIRIKAENQAKFMSFYEFEVYASEEIPFASFGDNAIDNSAVIAALNNAVVDVVLNRSILANDTWYTLCLPFDMDADKVTEVFGNSTIAELKSSEDRGSLIHLNFDYVNAMEAGHAYLFKPGRDFDAGTIIEGVTIKNVNPTALKSTCDHMEFQGTFDKITLHESNQRFVGANNYLYSPNSTNGSPVGAFRCYFTIPDGSTALAPGKRAQIFFAPQTATGMESIQPSAVSCQKVIENGQLFIIRDGHTYNAQGMLVK